MYRVLSIALMAFVMSGCAQKTDVPSVVAVSADSGKAIVDTVRKIVEATTAAEAAGTLPRNAAVTAMEQFKRATDGAQKASTTLDKLLTLSAASPELPTSITELETQFGAIQEAIAAGLIPISDEGLRTRLLTFTQELIKTITSVNKSILALKKGGQ